MTHYCIVCITSTNISPSVYFVCVSVFLFGCICVSVFEYSVNLIKLKRQDEVCTNFEYLSAWSFPYFPYFPTATCCLAERFQLLVSICCKGSRDKRKFAENHFL